MLSRFPWETFPQRRVNYKVDASIGVKLSGRLGLNLTAQKTQDDQRVQNLHGLNERNWACFRT